jgi:multidrug resistance protein, MATE family
MFDGTRNLGARLSPWRAELRATLALAVPLVATQLAQIAILTTDVLMMGWIGPEALAAGALGANLFFVLGTFCNGILLAVAPMMAQAIGQKRRFMRDMRRSIRQGLWAMLALSVPSMVVIWHASDVLLLLGQDPGNSHAAGDYARALVWGFVPTLGFMLLRSFMAALERPRPALVVMLFTFVLNAVGAYVLMFGKLGFPAYGLVGAGVASTIANAFSFVAMLGIVLLDRRFRRFHILGHFWRADWRRFSEIFRIGLPIGTILLLETGLFSGALYLMGLIGTAELAAHQIAIQVAATSFMVPLGIGQAATVRVGLCAGAGDTDGVRRAGWTAQGLGIAFMAAMGLVMWSMPTALVGLFLDLDRAENAPVVALAVEFLAFAALFQVVDGAQTIAIGALRGLKDTRVPAILAGIGYWAIGFPVAVALAFGAGMGGAGIWAGLALGLAAVAAFQVWRFARRERLGLVPG